MMILRHETGHALNYVYGLWKKDEWVELFGNFRKRYPSLYHFNSSSRDYVRYLHNIGNPHYAQKHPDEDFAETFAVWLDPRSKWRWNYRDWPRALEKLRYVDRLFRKEKIAIRRPANFKMDERTTTAPSCRRCGILRHRAEGGPAHQGIHRHDEAKQVFPAIAG